MNSFDQVIERRNTASVKWDLVEQLYGSRDVLPMWVADMDFPTAQPVVEAIAARAQHAIYGYTTRPDSVYEAIQDWAAQRHGWTMQREWIGFSPGVVPGLAFLLLALSDPGDKVIIQPPVYHPFAFTIRENGRQIVNNPLIFEGGRYRMDFDDLRQKAKDGARLMILCSPHNPVGRVWTRAELRELGEICIEQGIFVISDEIHSDLLLEGQVHTPFAALGEAFAQNSAICTAPSKTFNLAGLQTSVVTIPNKQHRDRFAAVLDRLHLGMPNTFGLVAMEAAYRHGGPWLDALRGYLSENLRYLTDFLAREVPQIQVVEPQGTYLVWLDCRGLGLSTEELSRFMREDAKVGLDDGHIFGPGGDGFERINIACPRALLADGLGRIADAVRRLGA